MIALSPVGILILLLEGVRDALATIDYDSVEFDTSGREWAYKVRRWAYKLPHEARHLIELFWRSSQSMCPARAPGSAIL